MRGSNRSVGGAKHHAPEAWQREQGQRMFLIDEHGERPICTDCRKPFRATVKEVTAIRRQWPDIVVICRPCYRRRRARFTARRHAV